MRTPEEIRAIRVLAKAMAIRALGKKEEGSKVIRDFLVNDAEEIKLEIAREVANALGYPELVKS